MPTARRQFLENALVAACALAPTGFAPPMKNSPSSDAHQDHAISSPSGVLTAHFTVTEGGIFTYSLRDKQNRPLLFPSPVGVIFDNGVAPSTGGFRLGEIKTSRQKTARKRLFGEQGGRENEVPPFEQCLVTLHETAAPHRVLRVEMRLYDAGMAFRLTLPPTQTAANATEQTHFVFPNDAVCYESYQNEDEFRPVPPAALKKGNWLPFTVQAAPHGPYFSVAEVDDTQSGMPQTLLSPSANVQNAVVTSARGPVPVSGGEETVFPWRVVVWGETPALLAQTAPPLIRSLWPPSVITDTQWIKPGKAIRETTLSTRGGEACIDFAAQNGLQYVLYDAGWYGAETDDKSDARAVHLDPARSGANHPGLDLTRVIAHGKEKGVGVFLYVNRRALEKQLPELAPLYQSWGVAGIKFGFVNTGTVEWTRWMRESIALCARHHLLVDIHDAYRPVGLSGAYPNLLTQEGIRGNEHMPTPHHNCTLPFTRFLSGPADYTVCYRNHRLQTTDAHQLALSVLYYSPLQLIYWYGQPKDYAGLPEVEFFKRVSTIWDETVWLDGEIGQWAAVARRSGNNWFVGAITSETARTVALPLLFLAPGKAYNFHSFADRRDANGQVSTVIEPGVSRIEMKTETVRRGKNEPAALSFALAPAGGIAGWLTPAA